MIHSKTISRPDLIQLESDALACTLACARQRQRRNSRNKFLYQHPRLINLPTKRARDLRRLLGNFDSRSLPLYHEFHPSRRKWTPPTARRPDAPPRRRRQWAEQIGRQASRLQKHPRPHEARRSRTGQTLSPAFRSVSFLATEFAENAQKNTEGMKKLIKTSVANVSNFYLLHSFLCFSVRSP